MWYISLPGDTWYIGLSAEQSFKALPHAQIENLPSLHHGQQCVSNMALIRVLAWGGTGGGHAPQFFAPNSQKMYT